MPYGALAGVEPRAIAKALNADESTIRADTAGNPAGGSKKLNQNKNQKSASARNPARKDISGEAGREARRAPGKDPFVLPRQLAYIFVWGDNVSKSD